MRDPHETSKVMLPCRVEGRARQCKTLQGPWRSGKSFLVSWRGVVQLVRTPACHAEDRGFRVPSPSPITDYDGSSSNPPSTGVSNNSALPTRCAYARSDTVPSHDDNGFIIEWLCASAKCMECRRQSCAERFGGVAVKRPRHIHKAA